jgi:hypothetical protein
VLGYAGLASGEDTVAAMVAAAKEQLPAMEDHRTTPDLEASIGRWRRDLPAELVQACERAVGPALEAWGYAPGPAARASATS